MLTKYNDFPEKKAFDLQSTDSVVKVQNSKKFSLFILIASAVDCYRLQSHTEILPVKVSVEDVVREIRFFILSDTN